MLEHGSYLIEQVVSMGGGTFGEVHKVNVYNRKMLLCGQYAMKTMKSSAREAEEFRQRFTREGHLQSGCVHHNIVPIYICNLSSSEPWFVMELGETDVEKLIINGNFPANERLNCIRDLLLGMHFIHNRGLLHRDIKPSNMVKVGNLYKIADFGLVKNTNPNPDSVALTAIGVPMGTPGFIAPEAVFGHFSVQTDIFAIGTFIYCVTYNDEYLFKKLSPIFNKCRQEKPADRYQTVERIIEVFLPIFEELNNA
ncbi:serine/threonine protein kinase [Acinetobacter guillouiae]|uniref:serine/threonine protein kinase n=1 Tax=Acinetobacter guillouiae TaxID=106649 RepID=UPI003AF81231